MNSKYSRKQMTPGMKACKDKGSPFTKASKILIQGAGNATPNKMASPLNDGMRKTGGIDEALITGAGKVSSGEGNKSGSGNEMLLAAAGQLSDMNKHANNSSSVSEWDQKQKADANKDYSNQDPSKVSFSNLGMGNITA
jgi:hypothetical protein|tara:strand:+ start:54 stop:470 length:417 start_codon:yes stop_codon:yes gene_type:complete